ncbi:hypothetical protein D3C74_495420 [compost metagenome]
MLRKEVSGAALAEGMVMNGLSHKVKRKMEAIIAIIDFLIIHFIDQAAFQVF